MSHEDRMAAVATDRRFSERGSLQEPITAWMTRLSAAEMRTLFQQRALSRAGIDVDRWAPQSGTEANRSTIEAVYAYYGRLYLDDPDVFWWAGMAAMIGGSFVGGFTDLASIRGALDDIRRLLIASGSLGVLPSAMRPLVDLSADELQAELRFYESTLLSMQKEIFFDMATAHEAYLSGGMAAIRRLFADDAYGFGAETIAAWQLIDDGVRRNDSMRIAAGNAALLEREQLHVIDDDYDLMRAHPVTGEAMTFLMTTLGSPSLPGTQSFADLEPAIITLTAPHLSMFGFDVGGVSATVTTPFPTVNVANADDRWDLVTTDTLPAFIDLLTVDPDRVADLVATPVGERSEAYRAIDRLDDLVAAIDLDVSTRW
jgi:hypothetical protein